MNSFKQLQFLLVMLIITPLSAKKDKDSVLDSINQRAAYIAKTVNLINEKQKCSTVIMQSDVGTTGYVITEPGDYCLGEDITFAPGNPINFTPITITDSTGTGAEGLAAVSGGVLRGIFVIAGGSNYSDSPTITVGGSGAGASVTATVSGGVITSFNITAGGSGYQDTVQAAITIQAAPVNLQLNNHTLAQAGAADASTIPNYSAGVTSPSSQVPFVVGILIPDTLPTDTDVDAVGLESIYISGDQAIVNGFSMCGIRVLAHTADIRISKVTIENTALLGTYYLRPFALYQPSGIPTYAPYPGPVPFGFAGLLIGETDFFGSGPLFFTQKSSTAQNRISSVVLEEVSCLNNFMIGLGLFNTTDVTISGCHFDGTLCDDPTLFVIGATIGGTDEDYEDPSIINMTVRNSSFNNTRQLGDYKTVASGTFDSGIYASFCARSSNVLFDGCTFDHTYASFPGGTYHIGCLNAALNNVTYANCSFSDLEALGVINDGFHISGHEDLGSDVKSSFGVRLINCVANNITYIGDQQIPVQLYESSLNGYTLDYVKNLYVENCVASNVVLNGPAASYASASGIQCFGGGDQASGDNYEADNTVLRGCVAQGIMTTQGGYACGFDLADTSGTLSNLRTLLLEDCIAEGNIAQIPTAPYTEPPYSVVQGVACGFIFERAFGADSGYPLSFVNCKALYNQGYPSVSTTDGEGTFYSAGFFDIGSNATFPTQNHTYYGCEASNNVYGFLFSNDQSIVVRDCRADNNLLAPGTTGTVLDGTIGEGFTDLGLSATTTPTAVGISASLFEANHAYNNGLSQAPNFYYGENNNYNIQVAAGVTPPILEGQVSTSTYAPINPPTYFASVHNNSIIK